MKPRPEGTFWPLTPHTPGSLGIAISEAIEQAVTDPTGQTRYSLGSVLEPCYAAPDHHWSGSQKTIAEIR